ncbi:hypothetical protein SteCoe_18605 [Stentor coeruleus]|uniref:J domain-containing protein n=1 Tax=Stentor coeruleus TaxID=5963 RepID=A0A1R2BW92_9CILI|nr:hypothetical protein SteCoe_18605 [Stentor coeruleus]
MNKEEAEKLFKQAQEAMKTHDIDKAIYLLQKSVSLYYTDQASKLLKKAKNTKKHTEPKPEYTQENEQLSKNLLNKTDYYSILNIPRTASQDDIKKAYRKLVIKFHPDKNKAPSAEDAFRHLQKAYECLTDDSRKAYYDDTGTEAEMNYHMDQGFTSEMILAIVLNFFGGSIFSPDHYIHRKYNPEFVSGQQNFGVKVKIVPILIFVMLIGFSACRSEEAEYSFVPSPYFSSGYSTENLKIPYFLAKTANFTAGHLKVLETTIEENYMGLLNKQCEQNLNYKHQIMNKAKMSQGSTAKVFENYAESIDLSPCKTLESLINP